MTGAFLRIMRPNRCWTILHVSILAGLLLTLNAHNVSSSSTNHSGGDSDCFTEIIARRNTVYDGLLGQEFKINCTVHFCNNSPPAVTWEKLGETHVPVNVSSDSHIKTKWEYVNKAAGITYLIFSKIVQSDSGQYRCRSGASVSHAISVNVHDDVKLTTASRTTLAAETVIPADTFCPFLYRVIGILVFVILVILIFVIPKQRCKGKLRKTTKPSQELALHVYDNDI